MTRRIAAYTPISGTYPPYLNIKIDGDDVTVTVRNQAHDGEKFLEYGATAAITIPKAEFTRILEELTSHDRDA